MKKINLGGVEVGVVNEQEAERAAIVACMRVADLLPIAPTDAFQQAVRARSVYLDCAWCGEKIICDIKNAPMAPPKVCIPCIAAKQQTAHH